MSDTRRNVLVAVRDQVQLLNKDAGATGPRWTPENWWESFKFLFVNGATNPNNQHQDDLLFFVRGPSATLHSIPFFVLRKGKELPAELQISGKDFSSVDWPQTVLLNIVLQSQYQLTVVACGPEALPFVAEGRTWSSDMTAVTKPVFASPTETAVNLDSSRAEASNPASCFPQICFAVDNFEDAFGCMVLEDLDQCYCVVLHVILDDSNHQPEDSAYTDLESLAMRLSSNKVAEPSSSSSSSPRRAAVADGLAAAAAAASGRASPAAAAADPQPRSRSALAIAVGGGDDSVDESPMAWRIGTRKRTLFAGYVSFKQILDFISMGKSGSLLDSLLGAQGGAQTDKVVMTGPGGTGRAEVAVTKLPSKSGRHSSRGGSSIADGAGSGLASASGSGAGSGNGALDVKRSLSSGGEVTPEAGSSSSSPQADTTMSEPGSHLPRPPVAQQKAASLLERGLFKARQVANGIQRAVAEINASGSPAASGQACSMQCALMLLKLPVQYIAKEVLEAV